MNISIIGTGYVGLVSGACLADIGHHITCVDIDTNKIQKLQQGVIPIYEPFLEEIVQRNIEAKRLRFTTDLKEALSETTVVFLCLPTPPGEDGSADLSYVMQVAEDLTKNLQQYTVIVNKSTVPVGTAEAVCQLIESKTKIEFDVVSNPEFLREGYAVEDFMNPDRVVIGSGSSKAIDIMKRIYLPLIEKHALFLVMDEKSSELTKYAANAFLASKITFMNELANYCELIGANIDDIRTGMGTDDRIGSKFLMPGMGYGGSCFPKDVKALLKAGQNNSFDFHILNAVEKVNHQQKTVLKNAILEYFNNDLMDKGIALWGLAFKPNTDDIREAPALYLIDWLLTQGAHVRVYDPAAIGNVKVLLGDKITYADTMMDALIGQDVLVIATEWAEFKVPDFGMIADKLTHKAIFDGRNMYDPKWLKSEGFYYKSIGRETIIPSHS